MDLLEGLPLRNSEKMCMAMTIHLQIAVPKLTFAFPMGVHNIPLSSKTRLLQREFFPVLNTKVLASFVDIAHRG